MGKIRLILLLVGTAVIGLVWASGEAHAQDMEPRAYSASPIDTNFVLGSYSRVTGAASLDPSLPIKNLKGSINGSLVAYDRTFELFGQQASAAVVLPFFDADFSGEVFDASKQVNRKGLGDIRFRITESLIGGPALTPAEFVHRQPTTTVGISFAMSAPTGDYNPQHVLNVSTHRWSFKPEVGFSQPFGDFFLYGSAGVWLFTDNGNYFGGDTILDGINTRDFQSVTRYGATLSVPLADGLSAKVAWSSWLTAHNGGAFDSLILTMQYRWFDR